MLLRQQQTDTPLAEGSMLGRFRLHCLIGRGGWGQVWAAKDTGLHRLVAIKAVPISDNRAMIRIMQDARLTDNPR